ncbi:MAG TPA: cysteine--tRNA ligase [Alphaproteobacteria bacterium]|nr:cysteine--tRNA ligase [Alphaproteobacteria bacterium]
MGLVLYNTLTRKKEPFEPDDPKSVRMYVCGPTVYDFAHVGNARPVVVFDVLFRLLKKSFPDHKIIYVRNITDIDDKIIKAAAENNEPIANLTARTEQAFHEDMDALGALPPTHEPRATQHIPGMIAMIERLIESGHAYEAEGHVLFGVGTKSDYGKLSRRDRDEMIAGARVEVAPYKKDPADFVLWKPSAPDQPGWESPWGRGRPGWHLECSVMSEAFLGETFDIHGGGLDLVFPHHENEIAQSECAHGGAPFVRFWLHNGYVTVEGEKMSKSLGNFFTVRQLLEEGHRGEAIRLALLSAHYRQPLDFSRDALKSAKHTLDRFYLTLRNDFHLISGEQAEPDEQLVSALRDDLNTPAALARLHELTVSINRTDHLQQRVKLGAQFRASAELLGIAQRPPTEWLQGEADRQIETMITARNAARAARNFAEADRIRMELELKFGVILEDRPGGKTEWRRAG